LRSRCHSINAAKEHSYSPYSKFRVGAALLTKSGKIYPGCNVENASYGGAICAERTSFVKAVSEGDKEAVAVAVTTDQPSFVFPCGFCRQFMVEFNKHLKVILVSSTGELQNHVLSDLIPHSFGPQDLL
jgi:cytidine deaminase